MDMRELRPGDTITVVATVVRPIDNDEEYFVCLPGGRDRKTFVHYTEISSVQKRALKVSDRVNVNGATSNPGTIMAIIGDEAWVKWDSGPAAIHSLSYLYRVGA